MGGENDGQGIVLGSAEVRHPPDTGFEDFGPVLPLVNLAADADLVDKEAVFLWQGRVKVGKSGPSTLLRVFALWATRCRGDGRDCGDGIADS